MSNVPQNPKGTESSGREAALTLLPGHGGGDMGQRCKWLLPRPWSEEWADAALRVGAEPFSITTYSPHGRSNNFVFVCLKP